jgi:hypothetical protein
MLRAGKSPGSPNGSPSSQRNNFSRLRPIIFDLPCSSFVDCHQAVALLSRQIIKIMTRMAAAVRGEANASLLFVRMMSIVGYPKKLSRRIDGL